MAQPSEKPGQQPHQRWWIIVLKCLLGGAVIIHVIETMARLLFGIEHVEPFFQMIGQWTLALLLYAILLYPLFSFAEIKEFWPYIWTVLLIYVAIGMFTGCISIWGVSPQCADSPPQDWKTLFTAHCFHLKPTLSSYPMILVSLFLVFVTLAIFALRGGLALCVWQIVPDGMKTFLGGVIVFMLGYGIYEWLKTKGLSE